MKRRLQARDYTIGWIAALPIELAAAARLLDEEHEGVISREYDATSYQLGRMGVHNVVLACLPAGQIGTQSAATVASRMRSTFTSIQCGLMVGIGGGVPGKVDVRLGDIVVSQPVGTLGGVVQHDFGKIELDGKITRTGILSPPPEILLSALSAVQANHKQGKAEFRRHLAVFENDPHFDRKLAGPDVLFAASHNHQSGDACENCTEIVSRKLRGNENVAVHYGIIASGNQVIKDGTSRDRISSELGGVLCFEMEGAGLMNSYPCLVIRGICDYSDSHKNKKWQPFAAATAASFAKEVLSTLPNMHNESVFTFDFSKLPSVKAASFDSHEEEHNPTCLEHTRVDLMKQVTEWAQDIKGKRLYWLYGMAGTGKSTIARTFARSSKNMGILGASFFFKRGEGDRGRAAYFFSTIASDLIVHRPEIGPHVGEALERDPGITEKSLKDQFEQLILQPLSQIASTRTKSLVIVIDALDECDHDNDIRAILRLLEMTTNLENVSLRVFLTSRPELPIRLGFEQMSDGTYQDFVLHHVPKMTIEHDIEVFLRHEFEVIRKNRRLSADWPGDENIGHLVQMAVPLFIFAATICRFISNSKRNPRTQLKQILAYRKNSRISTLEMTYLPILNQIFDEEDAEGDDDEDGYSSLVTDFREIVGTIVVLADPLSISSLAHLLSIEKEDVHCTLDNLHSVLNIPKDDRKPVRLLHLSFRDFLLDPKRKGQSVFWVDEVQLHGKIASQCLSLLSKTLRQDICSLANPGTLCSEIELEVVKRVLPPEIQYACLHWVYHLEESRIKIKNGDQTHQFFSQHLLHWLEVMSLLGQVSEAIRMIDRLSTRVQEESQEVLNMIHDARMFVRYHGAGFAEAPLQLYVSALIFTPTKSVIRKRFQHRVPKWIEQIPKINRNWTPELTILRGHTDWVNDVKFSPNGSLLVSASRDRTIRVWDAATGQYKTTLRGHSDFVRSIAFSPNGSILASGSLDHTVRLWDLAAGFHCIITLEDPSWNTINTVAFSPAGYLAIQPSYQAIEIYEVSSRTLKPKMRREYDIGYDAVPLSTLSLSETVPPLTLSLDGAASIVSIPGSDTLSVQDTDTGRRKTKIDGFFKRLSHATLSSDGFQLALWDREFLSLWNLNTGDHMHLVTDDMGVKDDIHVVAFSPDGSLIALSSWMYTIKLWDTATGKCLIALEGHSYIVYAMSFSPDGTMVALASHHGDVRLWDTSIALNQSTVDSYKDVIFTKQASKDGSMAVSSSILGTVLLWDSASGKRKVLRRARSDTINAIAFSPDGFMVVSLSSKGKLEIYNTTTGHLETSFEYGGTGYRGRLNDYPVIIFSPDSSMIAASYDDSFIRIFSITGHEASYRIPMIHSGGVLALAVSPSMSLIAAMDENEIWLWDISAYRHPALPTRDLRPKKILKPHDKEKIFDEMAFSPNGSLLAAGSYSSSLSSGPRKFSIWNIDTGNVVYTIPMLKLPYSLEFSPDCRFLITNYGYTPLPSNFSIPTTSPYILPNLSIKESWICSAAGKKLIWIPPEYRYGLLGVRGSGLVLGSLNDRLWFLRVSSNILD